MPQFIFRNSKKQIVRVALNETERDRIQEKYSAEDDLVECEEVRAHHLSHRRVSFYPWHSDGAGVNPDQIPEAYAASVKQGCPTHFDEEGRAIFTSPGHRERYLRANGLFDRKHGQRETAGPGSSQRR